MTRQKLVGWSPTTHQPCPPIMVAVHGYNFGKHHGTTIRLAHGRAVVIAAWRPTTRITILLPYGQNHEMWADMVDDFGGAPYGTTLVGNRTRHAPMWATMMHLPPVWSSTLVNTTRCCSGTSPCGTNMCVSNHTGAPMMVAVHTVGRVGGAPCD
jgi:hypothetical protein